MEPVAGALHGGWVHCRQRLVALRLSVSVFAQQAAHLTQGGVGLGAAFDRGGQVVTKLAGEAEAVDGIGLSHDDVGGEFGLQRVGGMQRGDGGHGGFVAGVGGVNDRRREGGAEGGENFAGDGGGEVREGLHGVPAPWRWRRGRCWC